MVGYKNHQCCLKGKTDSFFEFQVGPDTDLSSQGPISSRAWIWLCCHVWQIWRTRKNPLREKTPRLLKLLQYLHISISRGIKTQQLSQMFTPNCSPEWSHSSQCPKKNTYHNLILPLVDLPWLKRWLWNTSPGYGLNTRSMRSNIENTDTGD